MILKAGIWVIALAMCELYKTDKALETKLVDICYVLTPVVLAIVFCCPWPLVVVIAIASFLGRKELMQHFPSFLLSVPFSTHVPNYWAMLFLIIIMVTPMLLMAYKMVKEIYFSKNKVAQ